MATCAWHPFPLERVLPDFEDGRDCLLLESARPDAENARSFVFLRPERVLVCHGAAEGPAFLAALETGLREGCHAAGYFSHEFSHALGLPAAAPPAGKPLAWFGLYRDPPVFDHRTGTFPGDCPTLPGDRPEPPCAGVAGTAAGGISERSLSLRRGAYRRDISRIRQHLACGDAYQVNHTLRLHFRHAGSVPALYARLRDSQPVPYAALCRTAFADIVSLSPELFFRTREGEILTRPMKGTAARGHDAAEDDRLAAALAADPKNRAENLMITDLLRNDLGRIALPGSVRVEKAFRIERYPAVLQMTSTVRARLPRALPLAALLGALFPCASVTGAPKRRAMELIRDLEGGPRGVYCGAIGFFAPDGEAVFSVAIRTLELDKPSAGPGASGPLSGCAGPGASGPLSGCAGPGASGPLSGCAGPGASGPLWGCAGPGASGLLSGCAGPGASGPLSGCAGPGASGPLSGCAGPVAGVLGLGSGIVYDSTADEEWRECLQKGRFLTHPQPALQLVETLRVQDGTPAHAEAHLARMAASAGYFVFPFDAARARRELAAATAAIPAGIYRLRLLLDRYGAIVTETVPYHEPPENPRIVVSSYRVNPDEVLLYHKTTVRELYRRERERFCGPDILDVIFVNTRGELTEGAITNLWLELDGRLHTPPVAAGLLPGTMRARLLAERPEARERTLYPADLGRAQAIYLSNALLGLRRVLLSGRDNAVPSQSG